MNHSEQKPEIIGQGTEKIVYPDPNHPERVRAEMKIIYTNSQVKGAYYLTKIAHLLFPQNIPDIHLSTPNERSLDKKEHDEIHAYFQEVYQGKRELNGMEVEKFLNKIEQRVLDPRVKSFMTELENSGLKLDVGIQNISTQSDGSVVLFDNEVPWSKIKTKTGVSMETCYDPELLRLAIGRLPEDQRTHAETYLKRLEQLFEVYKLEKETE